MWAGYNFCSKNVDRIISFRNKIVIPLIVNGFSKKKYAIEQNLAQKTFMISNLHKDAYVKRSSSC